MWQRWVIALTLLTVYAKHSEHSELYKALENVKQSHLGRTLLETLQVAAENEEPLSNVVIAVQDVERSIIEAQQFAKEKHDSDEMRCHKELGALRIVIKELRASSVTIPYLYNKNQQELKYSMQNLQIQKSKMVEQLERKHRDLAYANDELSIASTRRKAQIESYENNMELLNSIVYQLTEVKKLFIKFLQVSGWKTDESTEKYFQFLDHKAISFQSISNTIHSMKKALPDKNFRTLLAQFSEIASRLGVLQESMDSDEEMSTHDKVEILSQSISTILRVCAQMSDFINILRELEQSVDKRKDDTFSAVLTQLEGEVFIAQRDITMFSESLETLDLELNELTEDKEEGDKKLEFKLSESENRKAECEEGARHFLRETESRNEQLETIWLVLELIDTKYGQLRKYLLRE